MTNNITSLSISPDVIKMLGRKLYTNHPLPIVVRELLQNSIDACKRYNITPKIKISIDVNTVENDITVTCQDNGEGMDSDTLINKFLCLGESGKRDNTQSTGGFGIAKAALMSNPFWSVYTHDLYTDSDMLGLPLKSMPFLDGTIVKVLIEEHWYGSTLTEALQMIYLSDVSITLLYSKNDEPIILDDTAGLRLKPSPDVYNDQYTLSLLESFNLPNDYQVSNKNVFRLNGLVQFIRSSYNRPINCVIDLITDKLPTDRDYPLSMSRESIESSINWDVSSKITKYDENPLTTESRLTDSKIESFSVFNDNGDLLGVLREERIYF